MLARMPVAAVLAAGLVTAAPFTSACGRPVDLTKALQITEITNGWFDAGIVDGKNKLVPSVTFRLKNVSDDRIGSVQINAMFLRLPDNEEWDAMLTQGVSRDGLAAGASTAPITVRGKMGFTGPQPRAEMMRHRSFQDVNVRIFGKHGAQQWVRLAEYRIGRQLLTR